MRVTAANHHPRKKVEINPADFEPQKIAGELNPIASRPRTGSRTWTLMCDDEEW